jgi:hypothetical protein
MIPKSFFIFKTLPLCPDCDQTKNILGLLLQTNVYLNFSN